MRGAPAAVEQPGPAEHEGAAALAEHPGAARHRGAQQVDDLAGKAEKVRDDLNTMMMEANGSPVAAVIGTLNEKADALKAQLTVDKADAQEDLGPKITAAQTEITTALVPVTTAVGKLCPSS